MDQTFPSPAATKRHHLLWEALYDLCSPTDRVSSRSRRKAPAGRADGRARLCSGTSSTSSKQEAHRKSTTTMPRARLLARHRLSYPAPDSVSAAAPPPALAASLALGEGHRRRGICQTSAAMAWACTCGFAPAASHNSGTRGPRASHNPSSAASTLPLARRGPVMLSGASGAGREAARPRCARTFLRAGSRLALAAGLHDLQVHLKRVAAAG